MVKGDRKPQMTCMILEGDVKYVLSNGRLLSGAECWDRWKLERKCELRTCKLQLLQWNLKVSGRTKWSTAGTRGFPYLQTSWLALSLSRPPIEGCRLFFGRKESGLCLELTAYCHVVLWLRMSGAWILLSMYAFMVCTGTAVRNELRNLGTKSNNRNLQKVNNRKCCK